ncbi:MAG TPA: hypothetical protein PLA81_02770 [Syntrophorhabdaceae bacterium]|nr:hypothetical protein [Syntrophorhabdaceae bacterium]HOS04776.1 hypothetical protein [Syntrophorhabdaceae bacterium]HPL40496.1 hypothetical protein [Syntrophorhabdaceae bacterium]
MFSILNPKGEHSGIRTAMAVKSTTLESSVHSRTIRCDYGHGSLIINAL